MPRAVILCPWRGKEPEREAAWKLIREYYSGFEIVTADTPGDFNLCGARNLAAKKAGDWDVALFTLADVVVPVENISRAFDHALETGRITIPHDVCHMMTEAGHREGADAAVPIGNPELESRWKHACDSWQNRHGPSGIEAFRRDTFEELGPWDERFITALPEDASLLIKAGGFDRLSGPSYVFWHPVAWQGAPREYGEPWPAYRSRYLDLKGRGEFRQNLVDENRTINDFGDWWWG